MTVIREKQRTSWAGVEQLDPCALLASAAAAGPPPDGLMIPCKLSVELAKDRAWVTA